MYLHVKRFIGFNLINHRNDQEKNFWNKTWRDNYYSRTMFYSFERFAILLPFSAVDRYAFCMQIVLHHSSEYDSCHYLLNRQKSRVIQHQNQYDCIIYTM